MDSDTTVDFTGSYPSDRVPAEPRLGGPSGAASGDAEAVPEARDTAERSGEAGADEDSGQPVDAHLESRALPRRDGPPASKAAPSSGGASSGSPPSSDAPSSDAPSSGLPSSETLPAESLFDSTRLLCYHTDLGQPAGPGAPGKPIESMSWLAKYRMLRVLGQGAQGVVYLAHREGVDGYSTRVAAKVYFRQRDREGREQTDEEYASEMGRVARQAQQVSTVQHDNLISIRDFVSVDETRVMVMEWVDGFDLQRLLDHGRFRALRARLSASDGHRLSDVIATEGIDHCRIRPGVAVDILRGCLSGLSALHHHGIAHCDLKPSNIMIKRTGTKKLIDFDSSCQPEDNAIAVRGTPYYMSPEQLRDRRVGLRSDIASLGYVLIEMLSGRLLFKAEKTIEALIAAKESLPSRLEEVLPAQIRRNSTLVSLCRKMIAPDPAERFPDADAADLGRTGAVAFHRELIKSDLAAEYDRQLAWWVEIAQQVPDLPEPRPPGTRPPDSPSGKQG